VGATVRVYRIENRGKVAVLTSHPKAKALKMLHRLT